ncbi:MAG: hypothetical protein HC822_20230 [Oscillochloris sp.]|nr:hypothetical protein [Oscillochloris sp.]
MARLLNLMLIAVVAVTAALFAPHPGAAYACSCIAPPPPGDALEQSQAVFSGTVLSIDPVAAGGPELSREVTFEVDSVWKGPIGPQIGLLTSESSASCGYDFALGQSYMVYAYEQDGTLATGLCTRTAPLDAAAGDVELLGPGEAPNGGVVGPNDVPPSETPAEDDSGFPWIPVTLGVVVIGALVIGGGIVSVRRNAASK